jgi:acyl-coenzyme A synthetase/AMP-(fatty) acid ligase
MVAVDEGQPPIETTWGERRCPVGSLASRLRDLGVQPGDRVAGHLPEIPATVVAMLATTSIEATWTAVSRCFGTRSVRDRLGQVEELVASLASVRHTVLVRSLQLAAPPPSSLHALLYDDVWPTPVRWSPCVDAEHPL